MSSVRLAGPPVLVMIPAPSGKIFLWIGTLDPSEVPMPRNNTGGACRVKPSRTRDRHRPTVAVAVRPRSGTASGSGRALRSPSDRPEVPRHRGPRARPDRRPARRADRDEHVRGHRVAGPAGAAGASLAVPGSPRPAPGVGLGRPVATARGFWLTPRALCGHLRPTPHGHLRFALSSITPS